jgi:hypothetical protein
MSSGDDASGARRFFGARRVGQEPCGSARAACRETPRASVAHLSPGRRLNFKTSRVSPLAFLMRGGPARVRFAIYEEGIFEAARASSIARQTDSRPRPVTAE